MKRLMLVLSLLAVSCDDPTSPLDDVTVEARYVDEAGSAPIEVALVNGSDEPIVLPCDPAPIAVQRHEFGDWVDLSYVGAILCRPEMDVALPAGATLTFTVFDVTAPEPGTYRFVAYVRLTDGDATDHRLRYSNTILIGP